MTRSTCSSLLDALLSDGMHHCAHSEEKGVTMTVRANGRRRAFQLAAPDPHGDIAEWAQGRAEGVSLPLSIGAGARGRCIVPAFVAEIDMARSRMRSGEKLIDARDLEKALSAEKLRPSIIARQGRKAFALWLFKEPQSMSFKERGEKYHSFFDSIFPDWEDVETPRSPFEMPLEAAGLEILNGNGPRYDLEELLPARTRAHGGDVLSIEAVQEELAARGWTVRKNVITEKIDIEGRTPAGQRLTLEAVETLLLSDMDARYKRCSSDKISRYIAQTASEKQYNPVLDFIKAQQWDGEDRIADLFTLLGVEEDDLSKTLVRKWLWQGIALLHNDSADAFGADGVLVLLGDQGLGKTSFFRALAMRSEWFGEGRYMGDIDKDSLQAALSSFIAELGEVGGTMKKADENRLKSFVTQSVDVFRPAYARHMVEKCRRTNIAATTNEEEYLSDPTGSRRWWTVPVRVDRIPHEKLCAPCFDAAQIWAQAYTEVMLEKEQTGQGISDVFRLTQEERDALHVRNFAHERMLPGEEEVLDILAEARGKGYTCKPFLLTRWKERYSALSSISAKRVGMILKKHGIKPQQMRVAGDDIPHRLYMLPDYWAQGQKAKTE